MRDALDAALAPALADAGLARTRVTTSAIAYRRAFDWGYVGVDAHVRPSGAVHLSVSWRDHAVEAMIAARSALGGQAQALPFADVAGGAMERAFSAREPLRDRLPILRAAAERAAMRLRRWTDREAVARDLLPEVDGWLDGERQTLLLVAIVLLAMDVGLPGALAARERLLAVAAGPEDGWVRDVLGA